MGGLSRSGFIAVGLWAAASGCTAARMSVPRDLSEQPLVLAVSRDTGLFGRGTMAVGEHRVTGFRRAWGGEDSIGVGNVSYHQERKPYAYALSVAGRAARGVQCLVSEAHLEIRQDTTMFGRPASSELEIAHEPRQLVCEIGGGDGGGRLRVAHAELPSLSYPTGRLAGTISLGAVTMEIRSIEKLEDGRAVAFAGFELRQGNQVVAAVETINDGRVWLARGRSPEVEEAAIAASSALLLNEEWNASVY